MNSTVQTVTKMPKKVTVLHEIRCSKCNKLLGKVNGSYEIKCTRCKEITENN